MGSWFSSYPVNCGHTRTNYRALVLYNDDGSGMDYTKPDDQVIVRRDGPSHGSGPYYKHVRHPYTDETVYWKRTKESYVTGDKTVGWTQSDWRGYNGGGRELFPSSLRHVSFTFNTTTKTLVAFNYTVFGLVVDSGTCYQCTASTALSGNSNGSVSWGPYSIEPKSWDDVQHVVIWIMQYFGIPFDAANHPYQYGAQSIRYGYPAPQASLTHERKIQKLDRRYNYTDTEPPKIVWRFDDSDPDRQADWVYCCNGIIPGRIRNCAATALAETASALPEVSANSVANVLEMASGISGIASAAHLGVRGATRALVRKLSAYKDPRNDWLSWRYVYNTTKMDIQDYREVTNRLLSMAGQPTFKVHGSSHDQSGFTVRCVKQYRTSDFDIAGYDTKRLLRTYGFRLSAYNMWDMVPFSFIVDWFTQIGPSLELASNWKRHYDFQATDTWYSYREEFEHGFVYFRWRNTDPSIPPVYVPKTVGAKTFTYRLADVVSIFT